MTKFYTVCLFGGASDKIDDKYKEKIEELGRMIANNKCCLVYGAGATGCMGAVARGVTEKNGYVFGVTPNFMGDFEEIYECDKLIKTRTMSERKTIMEEQADFFIIAPGGIGTMDEMFEVLTLKYLQQNNKPIIFYNIDNFYTDILDFIHTIVDKKFAGEKIFNLFKVYDNIEDIEAELKKELSKHN